MNIEFVQALFWALLATAGCIVLGQRIVRRISRRR